MKTKEEIDNMTFTGTSSFVSVTVKGNKEVTKVTIDNDDINNYYVNELKVIEILNYLKSIGINNIKDILKYKSNMFYESVETIKKNIPNDSIIVSLINEDVQNLDRIGY